jgi:hypothetical protein
VQPQGGCAGRRARRARVLQAQGPPGPPAAVCGRLLSCKAKGLGYKARVGRPAAWHVLLLHHGTKRLAKDGRCTSSQLHLSSAWGAVQRRQSEKGCAEMVRILRLASHKHSPRCEREVHKSLCGP